MSDRHGHALGHVWRTRASRPLLVAVAVAVLAAVLGVAAASALATTDLVVSGTAYTVAALERNLARQPGPWLGHALLVHARLGACSALGATPAAPCADWQPALVDLGAEATEAPLPLTAGGQEWRLALVRAIPVLGQLVPPPQRY
jgi:hypothetical protein